jgi:hypothetical protein
MKSAIQKFTDSVEQFEVEQIDRRAEDWVFLTHHGDSLRFDLFVGHAATLFGGLGTLHGLTHGVDWASGRSCRPGGWRLRL